MPKVKGMGRGRREKMWSSRRAKVLQVLDFDLCPVGDGELLEPPEQRRKGSLAAL